MNLIKFFMSSIFLQISLNAFSLNNSGNKSIDILISGGKTTLFFDNDSDNSNKGQNIFISGLYSIIKSKVVSPVIGIGLNFTKSDYEGFNSSPLIKDFILASRYYFANIGLKFYPSDKISIYTLGNIGKSFKNSLSCNILNADGSQKRDLNFNIDNHDYYGFSLIVTYQIFNYFSIGPEVIFNRHIMSISSVDIRTSDSPNTANQKLQLNKNFNELSTNITIGFDF